MALSRFSDAMLGVLIEEARRGARLSLRALEQQTGIANSIIYRIEAGQVSCTLENLARICDALGLPIGLVAEVASFNFILEDALTEESAGMNLLLTRSGARSKTERYLVLAVVCGAWEVANCIVHSTNPVFCAESFDYPTESLRESFLAYAQRWKFTGPMIETAGDRLSQIRSLRERPLEVLDREQLLNEGHLREYVKIIRPELGRFRHIKTQEDIQAAIARGEKLGGVPVWFPKSAILSRQHPADTRTIIRQSTDDRNGS